MSLQAQTNHKKRGEHMKTAEEGKAITEEIAKLLPEATEETKKDLLIILQWENMKQNDKRKKECEVV